MKRSFFVTGTDTGVGKTMATYALALCLRAKGFGVGVMKPVQSGVGDAEFLKKRLGLADDLREINPYCAKEPLAPHVVFPRAGIRISRDRIIAAFRRLQERHEIVLVEGAGGLLVPIGGDYFMADLAKDLGLELIVVARPGLGTINHTLLTVREAERRGLDVAGVIFSDAKGRPKGITEKTNPGAIRELSGIPILGQVPFLKKMDAKSVLGLCRRSLDVRTLASPQRSRTRELVGMDKQHVWHPFTQMKDWNADAPGEPLVIDRAEGSYLIDTDGRRYLDGVSSLWVTIHGHNRREINDAVTRQLGKLDHSSMLGLANTPAVELAHKLVEITPDGLEKVFYSDNGSTSIEVAVKMGYQYWQNIGQTKKTTICHLANSYHGDTLGSVSIGGIDLFHKAYRKLIFKTHQVDFPDCYRVPDGKRYPEHAFEAVGRFESFARKNRRTIAALVIEPIVQGAAGMIMWPKGVLKRFEEICRANDIFLICDEVATGFGRTGKMFACEHEDVHPDFLCVAKGLTGGYLPLAATLTTRRVFDGFVFPYQDMKTFFHGHTYTGNPLACAAALANLKIFEKERTLDKLRPKIGHLARGLEHFQEIPEVGDIRQRGFMVGIELVRDRSTKEPFAAEERVGVKVCQRARDYGVILRPLGNVIVLMPPLSISPGEIDHLLDATGQAIRDVFAETDRPGCGC
jgi:adenosylmethionine-8-amino-7-oxononanoate aminotransferase